MVTKWAGKNKQNTFMHDMLAERTLLDFHVTVYTSNNNLRTVLRNLMVSYVTRRKHAARPHNRW